MALTDNLVSYWKLDETSGTRSDSHGSNNLSDNNTVTYGTGKINNAASFTATNSEYLNIADASQTGLDFTSDFSVSAWIYLASDFSANGGAVFYKWGASQAAYGLVYTDIGGTNTIRFNGYTTGSGSNISFDWTQTLNTSQWYHLVFRYDASGHPSGTGTCEVYLDGSSLGTVTHNTYTGSSNTTGAFSISSLGSGIQWYWDGKIDEFGIWSKWLANDEIASLYNSGSGLAYPFTGGGGGSTFTPRVSFIM